jgi:GNAT superfamily N-acetyltransferase
MQIRQAVVEDARAIAEVHVQAWRDAYRDILPADFLAGLSVAEREASWVDALERGTPCLLVAEHAGRIVGFSCDGPCRDRGATATDQELWALYVVREHWSTGLGRRLWLASRQAMLERQATRISLWVIVGNERAMRFYESAGFVAERESLQSFTLGGATLRELRYAMVLDPQAPGAPRP